MIIIDEILVSDAIVENEFVCHLSRCRGACCVEGDYGAPLEESEIEQISRDLDRIKAYLSEESQRLIASRGFHYWVDALKARGTQLHENGACVFMVRNEEGIAACGIEKAHSEGKSALRKPISCHLYPVRVKKNEHTGFEALNYDKWEICHPACALGEALGVPVYKFVKDALIRKYGRAFYEQLEAAANYMTKSK